jgi:release factor glutamine methyltransferase
MTTHLLEELTQALAAAGLDNAAEGAQRIVAAAMDGDPSSADATQTAAAARELARRVIVGEPLAYVTGRQRFMGIELQAAPGALVPREETEILGRTALAALQGFVAQGITDPRVIDMCCGSCNLGCALAKLVPQARVWACDLTDGCIAVARRNVFHTGVSERVTVAQGDLFAPLTHMALESKVDLIVCNPPYISQGKLASERAGLLTHEPREAFDGGPYGLSIHQRVIRDAWTFLRPGGRLMFEFGLGQDRQLKLLFDRAKNYQDFELVPDSTGQARVAVARKPAT